MIPDHTGVHRNAMVVFPESVSSNLQLLVKSQTFSSKCSVSQKVVLNKLKIKKQLESCNSKLPKLETFLKHSWPDLVTGRTSVPRSPTWRLLSPPRCPIAPGLQKSSRIALGRNKATPLFFNVSHSKRPILFFRSKATGLVGGKFEAERGGVSGG